MVAHPPKDAGAYVLTNAPMARPHRRNRRSIEGALRRDPSHGTGLRTTDPRVQCRTAPAYRAGKKVIHLVPPSTALFFGAAGQRFLRDGDQLVHAVVEKVPWLEVSAKLSNK